ncbi:PqiC family protein [Roseospira navarrensis]|uniref:ABC-type transport auxiliary lipoprotein component domain-containing protein n=1 Tax=Roseospira navarrensis TaxID=140058 RepID=A0A7X1ZE19_9PROT|nr:PqiC family protein [Roseospira navarrensis]MQX36334.1 hypothetical protein [Roseospira navarrensis]
MPRMTMSAGPHIARAILCASLLIGCVSSPPVRYHTLTTPGAADVAGDDSASPQVLVQILPVAVPEGVARDGIVLKDPGGQVTVLQTDRWLAPVADDLKQVVADGLWQSVRATDTYDAPVPGGATALPRYRLSLRVERFDAIPGQAAAVAGAWTLRSLSDDSAHVCRWAGSQPLEGADGAAAAAALGRASHRLAARIGESLRRAVSGAADVCGPVSPASAPIEGSAR